MQSKKQNEVDNWNTKEWNELNWIELNWKEWIELPKSEMLPVLNFGDKCSYHNDSLKSNIQTNYGYHAPLALDMNF